RENVEYKPPPQPTDVDGTMPVEDSETMDEISTLSAPTPEFSSRFAVEFNILKLLGKGRHGCVFAANNLLDERNYAVKQIPIPDRSNVYLKEKL
ncbi:hypothetical protein PFISCL1PPCAC_17029, partial [Pristionchus fissidentatus]